MFVCAECGASQPMPGTCAADGSTLYSGAEDPLLGITIGAYRIARLLGVGGMGRVYKGVHPQIGSRVAIKVLSRECSDRRDLVERFFAEAKAVNVIRHESIVNVLDLATLPDGRPYIVMEYLDGSPLASIIEHAKHSGPLPLGGVARLIVEVLDALQAAHAKGIVHRDLKPDNIYVTPAGRAKVLDFGIAKLLPELGGSSTQSGSLLGTPHYMAPEQAAGLNVDARADLYAIGVILFECATLQRPFVAEALFDLLRKHIEQPPPHPRTLRPDMPEGLEQVILTVLAKSPEQRFGSAQAMSVALQHSTAQLPPAQWTPIQGAYGSRGASAAWAPTPPASWASTHQKQQLQNAPTQTSGQVAGAPVHATTRPGNKKGLWLALGGVLLIGGGITAAVLAGGGDKKQPTTTTTTTTTAQTLPAVENAGSAVIAIPTDTTPTPIPIPTDPWAQLPPEAAAELDKVFNDMFAQLPPEQMKMFPPELHAALKKYGAWSKIPDAERMALLGKIQNMSMTMMDGLDAALGDPDGASAGGGDPRTADGWVRYTPLSTPAPLDTKKLDPMKQMQWAIGEAKKLYPDAVLFRIDTAGVAPDGSADLTAVDGMLGFRFIVPSRNKRDPKKPIGAKVEHKCQFMITIDEDGETALIPSDWECKEPLLGVPKCNVKQIWAKALAAKPPAPKNAIAAISYYADFDGKARWWFNISDDSESHFSSNYFDDCN